jgi:hypothetical protein
MRAKLQNECAQLHLCAHAKLNLKLWVPTQRDVQATK